MQIGALGSNISFKHSYLTEYILKLVLISWIIICIWFSIQTFKLLQVKEWVGIKDSGK